VKWGPIVRFEDSVMINRPLDEVRASWTDFFNAPRMRGSNMLGLRQTSPRPLGVGATGRARPSAFQVLKRVLETNSP
jgi:hypothetical protein